jgi:Flp pilus assembly protein TadG
VEFILILPILLVVVAAVIGFGQALYTRLAVDAAAWSACRHAVATLDRNRAVDQAFRATRYTLSGFGLNPDSAQVSVTHWGAWQRGAQVRAQVCYHVPSPPVPLGEMLVPRRVCAQQVMPVYQLKSRW